MYTCEDVFSWLEEMAPPETAEKWDHIGLMVGSRKSRLTGAVLALDCTMQAVEKCVEIGGNLILTHHPFFFPSIDSIPYETPKGKLICKLIENKITVFSAHTNLDRANGGVNDVLAKALGLCNLSEIEENGIGCQGEFAEPIRLFSCINDISRKLGSSGFFINTDVDRLISKVFVCGGAFEEDLIPILIRKKPDLIVTGEMKHHIMLEFAGYDIAALAAGHDATERVILPVLQKEMKMKFTDIRVEIVAGLDYNKVVI